MPDGDAPLVGNICIANPEPLACFEPSDGLMCSLPAQAAPEAASLLEAIGSGGSLGAGQGMWRLGVSMPEIREAYEREVQRLVAEVDRRRRAGQPAASIARYVVEERRRIANQMRWRSGAGTRVLFEIRDWAEYGPGGRTFRNVEARYVRRGYTGSALHQQMIRGATNPNVGISETAIRGARYLRHGGRVVVVLSLATTAYVLLSTPEDQLPRVLAQEAGGFAGGALGASAGVGICLVFGIATGGWGLLACGVLGGVAGGAGGSWAGDRLYLSASPAVERQVNETAILDVSCLATDVPPHMCVAPYTR